MLILIAVFSRLVSLLVVMFPLILVMNVSKCSDSSKTVAQNHRAVNCDQCHKWCHIKCGQVKPGDCKVLQNMVSFDWVCPPCLQIVQTLTVSQINISATTTNETTGIDIQELMDPLSCV